MKVRTHNGGWAVFARWLGKERPYGGRGTSIWAALRWKQRQEER